MRRLAFWMVVVGGTFLFMQEDPLGALGLIVLLFGVLKLAKGVGI